MRNMILFLILNSLLLCEDKFSDIIGNLKSGERVFIDPLFDIGRELIEPIDGSSLKTAYYKTGNLRNKIISLELKEKILEERALSDEKLKELEEDIFATKESLRKVEVINTEIISTSEEIKFKESKENNSTMDFSNNTDNVSDFLNKSTLR